MPYNIHRNLTVLPFEDDGDSYTNRPAVCSSQHGSEKSASKPLAQLKDRQQTLTSSSLLWQEREQTAVEATTLIEQDCE